HPPARRDGRHRLAGARRTVEQGLRGRDPRPAGRRPARGDARRDGGVRVARRTSVPCPPGARNEAGPGHGRRDPGAPAAGRLPPRSGLTPGYTQRSTRLRQAYRMPRASTPTKIAISTTVTIPKPGLAYTTAHGNRNTLSTAKST